MNEPDLAAAALEIMKGPESGRMLPLAAGNTTLGRVAGNSHVVGDATVSRQHAKVFLRDGRHWIADLNSSHGTFVNGAKVTLQTLTDGDEVRLGTTVLRYHASGKRAAAVPPPTPLPPAARPAAAAPPAPPAVFPAEPRTGSFELELPDVDVPKPAARVAVPPPAAPGRVPPEQLPPVRERRSLTVDGEDPFAEEANAASSSPAAGAAKPAAASNAPSIELRGETARHFASRSSAQPIPASSPKAQTAHVPPPIAKPPRTRGPFAFLRDELDQRGPAARVVALLFALAAAAALFWGTLALFDLAPSSAPQPTLEEEEAPTGPARPVLPQRNLPPGG